MTGFVWRRGSFEEMPCLSGSPHFRVDHVEAWGCIPVHPSFQS
jgi:hypothetical protein